MEYLRRSRPLRFTKWSITEVSRWMRYHVHGKDQNEDCGAFAKYFQPGDNGGQSPFPADMLAWEKTPQGVQCGVFSAKKLIGACP